MTVHNGKNPTSEAKRDRAAKILQGFGLIFGEVPEELRGPLGVNADGTPAPGGITRVGVHFAGTVAELMTLKSEDIGKVFDAISHKQGGGRPRTATPTPSMASVLDALELRGPLRAALRAAAQHLAAALDDGATDDAGMNSSSSSGSRTNSAHPGDRLRRLSDGTTRLVVELGDSPYVLLRMTDSVGEPVLTVTTGGDGMADVISHDPDDVTAHLMLGLAHMGVKESKARGVSFGGAEPTLIGFMFKDVDEDPGEVVATIKQRHADGTQTDITDQFPPPPRATGGPNTEHPFGVPFPDSRPAGDDEGVPAGSPAEPESEGANDPAPQEQDTPAGGGGGE